MGAQPLHQVFLEVKRFGSEQHELIRKFYHLDYFDTHTLDDAAADLKVGLGLDGPGSLAHNAAAAYIGAQAANLKTIVNAGAGIGDLFKTAYESGPWVLLKGIFWTGPIGTAQAIIEAGVGYLQGGLAHKDWYDIAYDVWGTALKAALLLYGLGRFCRGFVKVTSAVKSTPVPRLRPAPGRATTADVVIDASPLVDAAKNVGQGILLMSGSSGGDKGNAAVPLQRVYSEACEKYSQSFGKKEFDTDYQELVTELDKWVAKKDTMTGEHALGFEAIQRAVSEAKKKNFATRKEEGPWFGLREPDRVIENRRLARQSLEKRIQVFSYYYRTSPLAQKVRAMKELLSAKGRAYQHLLTGLEKKEAIINF